MDSDSSSSFGGSFAWWWTSGKWSASRSANANTETTTHFTVASMRIERFYASIREDASSIIPAAKDLLDRQDYISFFKACGPTYIRGIRRAQEVTAVLSYDSTNSESASEYAVSIQSTNFNLDYSTKSKFNSMSSTLNIGIKAWGIGLTATGSESLLATSVAEFNKVMKFAYNLMTKSPFANHVGMVYGMEVAPWVENIQFQIQAGLQDTAIEIPLPVSLIPLSFKTEDNSNTDYTTETRDEFQCKDLSYAIDKYGLCCETGSLYDYTEGAYTTDAPETKICRPVRALDKSMVTENMATNGEFVARLDRALRYKMNQMSLLEKCISAINAVPERYDHHFLQSQDTVNFDQDNDSTFTVFDLRMSLDPFGDYAMVGAMAKELDEFLEMFYSPCLNALFGANVGVSSSTDPSFFMAYPWYHHDECSKLSCLASGMRWDREDPLGGCVPSLLSGAGAPGYDTTAAQNCALDTEATGATETCKHDTESLDLFHKQTTQCWREALPSGGGVSYFLGHFCMPKVTSRALNEDAALVLAETKELYCNGTLV